MSVVFEDLHKHDGQGSYAVVNESVGVWRRVLENIPNVDTAASIASGGEVSFFAIAPKVRKALTCIDHSYTSMYFAIGKAHLINKLGTKAAFKALVENDVNLIRDAFKEANKGLPTAFKSNAKEVEQYLKDRAEWQKKSEEWFAAWVAENPRPVYGSANYWREEDAWYRKQYPAQAEWNKKNPVPQPPPNYYNGYTRGFDDFWASAGAIIRIYQEIGQKAVAQFRAKRDKVKFLHGDLSDLEARGPFDLVYLSNALQFNTREGKRGGHDPLKWVKPGGYIALTNYAETPDPELKSCKVIAKDRKQRGVREDVGLGWVYHLVQAPA
jgi:hypothetical protein